MLLRQTDMEKNTVSNQIQKKINGQQENPTGKTAGMKKQGMKTFPKMDSEMYDLERANHFV